MYSIESQRKVVQGICGWSDPSLSSCKRFFPPKTRTGTEKLSYISRHGLFGCVEVDSSTYNIPSPATVQSWVDAVPNDFYFHIKAFSLLCSTGMDRSHLPIEFREKFLNRCDIDDHMKISMGMLDDEAKNELWRLFHASINPAITAKKLGFIIFQFQGNFSPTLKSKAYLSYCAMKLHPDCRMVVDFRDRRWIYDDQLQDTIQFLKNLRPEGVILAASDDLVEEMHLNDPSTAIVDAKHRLPIILTACPSSMAAYIRIHRRQGDHRVLSREEVSEWIARIRDLLEEKADGKDELTLKGPVFVMWATDYDDQPIINAKNLAAQSPADMLYEVKTAKANTLTNFFQPISLEVDITAPVTTAADLFYPHTGSSIKKRSSSPVSASSHSSPVKKKWQSTSKSITSYFQPSISQEPDGDGIITQHHKQ